MKKLLLILPFICLLLLPVACSHKEQKVKMTPEQYNNALTASNSLREFAMAKMKEGDVKGAIEDYDKALEIFPDGGHLYQNRALAKMAIKDYEGAIADFKELKKYYPNLSQDADKNIERLKQKLKEAQK